MTVFDSSVVPGLPKACPPKGMLVAEISPHVSFSLPEVIFDVRLWSSTVLVFDQALVSSAVIPPDRFSPVGWLRTPFRQSEMRFFHLWRLDNPSPSPALSNRSDRLGNGFVRGTDLRVLFDHARKNWSIRIDYRTNSGNKWTCPRAALAVRTAEPYSRVVCVFDSASENQLQGPLPGKGFLRIVLPEGFAFHRGEYSVDFRLWERKEPADDVVSALTFQVDAESESPGWLEHHPYKEGIVNVIHHWLSGTENPEGDEK